jgi:hypothetical protein
MGGIIDCSYSKQGPARNDYKRELEEVFLSIKSHQSESTKGEELVNLL